MYIHIKLRHVHSADPADMADHREYVSLSCDNIAVFPRAHGQEGQRTALDLYEDYMLAFSQWMQPYIEDGTLVEIQVGCGPCGELRYPSYPLSPREHSPDGWTWPGIGELQCYDVGMMRDMRDILQREETPDGLGQYNDAPDDTPFWRAPSSVSLASLTSCLGGSTKEQERWDSQKVSQVSCPCGHCPVSACNLRRCTLFLPT